MKILYFYIYLEVIFALLDPDRDPTFKEVSAPTKDPDPVSDPATLVSAARWLHGKLALYS
jgi:hypothetical protein